MDVSYDGINRIVAWAGYSTYAQPDGTIGVKHKLTDQEKKTGVIEITPYIKHPFIGGLTLKQIRDVLRRDVHEYEKIVNKLVHAELDQRIFDILVAFCITVGKVDFIRSAFVDRINNGEDAAEVADDIVELVEAFKG